MIKVIVKNTHSKFFFDDASKEEASSFKNLLKEKFTVRDSSLDRDYRVQRGLMSPFKCFYNEEYDIIQTGLMSYVSLYAKKNNVDLVIDDHRKFQEPNKKELEHVLDQGIGKFQLRDYQKEALLATLKHRSSIVSLPPSSGKSLIIAGLCKVYSKANILLLFNAIDLIDQTYRSFVNDYDFKKEDIDIVGMGESISTGARITMLSIQSYKNLFSEFPYVDIIVADEAHSVGRTETSEKIIFSCQNASHKYGFSATPDIIDNPYEQMRLYANLGPVSYKKSFEQQIQAGVLADTKVIIHTIPPKQKLKIVGSWNDIYIKKKTKTDEEKKKFSDEGYDIIKEGHDEFARKFLEFGDEYRLYIGNEDRNLKIKEIAESNERVLVLFSKIKHGQILKELIPSAILISGKDDSRSRTEAKKSLMNDKKSIILASSIFDIGVDIPAIKNLVVAGSHVNTGRIVQKAGRVTRKNESIGKITATIHDFSTSENALAIKQTKRKIKVYEEVMKLEVVYQ